MLLLGIEMTIEKQMQDSVISYIANQIKNYKGSSDDWVFFNGAVVLIKETWSSIPEGYTCQGTVSEALYHIEENSLLYFLTAKV